MPTAVYVDGSNVIVTSTLHTCRRLPDGEGFIFTLMFGKAFREASHTVVVRKDIECQTIRMPSTSNTRDCDGEEGPTVATDGSRKNDMLEATRTTSDLQTTIQMAGLEEGKR